MDYRELENRIQRNRDLIKERQYERVIEEAMKANQPQRVNLLAGLWAFVTSIMQRKPNPQAKVELKPRVNSKIVKQRLS